MEQLTLTQNYYQLRLKDLRKLRLKDLELVEVLQKACCKVQELFEKTLVFPSLSGDTLMLHIKCNSIQKYSVELLISSECYSATSSRFVAKILPKLLPYCIDDQQLITTYSLGMAFLQIITDKPTDVCNYEAKSLLTRQSVSQRYPICTELIRQLLE